MKKLYLLLISMLLMGGANFVSASQIELEIGKIDPTPSGPGHTKEPVIVPYVWQEDHELEIEAPHAEYVLNIVSGTTVVYSVVVPETVSLVVLPATLSGTYELQLIQGNLCFYGYIDL